MQEHFPETAYITKYALTDGIIVCHTGYFDKHKNYMCQHSPRGMFYAYSKSEAWRTLEEAKSDAENRRLRKITSLKKQLAKLEKLEVKVKEDFFK
jgi:hypothetical protein